ncbi:membrane-spanning 4-domains subfamily A member 4A-like [Patiria miniata]|uniref:Membrane-spanning 4-domains subfamily A member 4A-like n=1 Tax=Patiria miniata TaxID=46514 RepID=A0A914BGD6_PATMI|nr:membrane-spanning 4-domains subfamily A member 4A-like [Patiria miniata]
MMTAPSAPPAYVAAPQPVGQQQLETVQPAPQPRSGNWTGILWTGVIQVVLGSLTTILGIVTMTVFKRVFYVSDIGSPIWCGVLFYVVAGIMGIVSGWKKNSRVAIGYMIMSILACLAACCVIGFGANVMASINIICFSDYHYDSYNAVIYSCDLKLAVNGVYGTVIILALVEFVVAIVGASLTCGLLCCGGSATQTVIHYQPQPHVVATTQPQGPAFYKVPIGQP